MDNKLADAVDILWDAYEHSDPEVNQEVDNHLYDALKAAWQAYRCDAGLPAYPTPIFR